ncbi:armadillo repeat-containing protein 3 [Schistocerca cancellata]|uniref:armadillo repeat-containing protein 3 n=1 Tax=Schistocerca cancellata TaxID=274614 RepID=UPI00211789CA|nr:armadillo repeat-containing protein 3 [Schistocerca cancellata]
MQNFVLLDELLSQRASPICPFYFAYFEPPQSIGNLPLSESPGEKKTASSRRGSEPVSVKKPDKTEELLARFGTYTHDPYLPHYLEQVKTLMNSLVIMKDRDVNQILRQRVKILATFVAKQMAGKDPGLECTYHSHDLHITEIKHYLGSNIIPLGYIRSGYYLERAMLFKVLADRISLPCTLVRGNFGHSWVEIAMVEYSVSQDDTNEICKVPSRICKPNCVVDLMNNIGQIWVLGSSEANIYCGKIQ